MIELLRRLSWPEVRHHPWRTLAALLAVTLGVALAYSVHLINQSALGEFSAAVRAVNGAPDFELRGPAAGFDEALYARVARHPAVAIASPIVDTTTVAEALDGSGRGPLRVIGLDALVAAPLTPALMPHPAAGSERHVALDPGAVFLNAQAARRLVANDNATRGPATTLRLRGPTADVSVRIAGFVTAPGPPLAVMDIAGAQAGFGRLGRLDRIDVRLAAGADRAAVLRELALPPGVRAAAPSEAEQQVGDVSRAYRVNLTVLALVALFTGAFLVFSILSLSVAQRQPQFALLGVLGLGARERLRLVLAESALLGALGSAFGLLLGTGLAALALRAFGGDLGGGYFAGVAPPLQVHAAGAWVYGSLGIVAALLGGGLPARLARDIAPAQALKGLGSAPGAGSRIPAGALGLTLLVASVPLSLLPPLAGVPLAAYAAVACLLFGGIACVPAVIGFALARLPRPAHPLWLLALGRARHQRQAATIAVAGVVASLSLAVALTVMVGSFRGSMLMWLDQVLPADLYVRVGGAVGPGDTALLPAGFAERAVGVAGVRRVASQRVSQLQLEPGRPAVALIARTLDDPATGLPLVGPLIDLPAGETAAYVSEAMVDLYAARPGTRLALPLPNGSRADVFVRGVWRDYARQFGAIALHAADYRRLTDDAGSTDLALWLAPGVAVEALRSSLRALASAQGFDGARLEFAEPAAIRAISLRIFDRSFAVTYWLQAIAIAIGLAGIAASFSAQVLARRKEFGLLAHLGFTRAQVLGVVTAECAVWTAAGALLGLALGLAVSVILVEVVNPQSFHWTMELAVPWLRLAALTGAVLAAGTATGWLAARGASPRQLALAVKEDW